MCCLSIKCHADNYTLRSVREFDLRGTAAERVFNELLWNDFAVRSREIETHAAVFRFHPRGESAAFAQIDRRGRGVPIVRRRIPLLDVVGRRVGTPDLIDRRGDVCLDGDFHATSPCWWEPETRARRSAAGD